MTTGKGEKKMSLDQGCIGVHTAHEYAQWNKIPTLHVLLYVFIWAQTCLNPGWKNKIGDLFQYWPGCPKGPFLEEIWISYFSFNNSCALYKRWLCQSYKCFLLLGIFLCVKNTKPCWRLVKLSKYFFDIFHNSYTWHKIVKVFL